MSDVYLGFDGPRVGYIGEATIFMHCDELVKPRWEIHNGVGLWNANSLSRWQMITALDDPARAGELYKLNPATLAFELVEKIELKSSPGSVGDKTKPGTDAPMKQPD